MSCCVLQIPHEKTAYSCEQPTALDKMWSMHMFFAFGLGKHNLTQFHNLFPMTLYELRQISQIQPNGNKSLQSGSRIFPEECPQVLESYIDVMLECPHISCHYVFIQYGHSCMHIHMDTYKSFEKLTHPVCPTICFPSISLHLFSLINLSTFCHLSGWERRTKKNERKRERERDKQRDSCLVCRLFGLIQENVESPLISNLPFPSHILAALLSNLSICSSNSILLLLIFLFSFFFFLLCLPHYGTLYIRSAIFMKLQSKPSQHQADM